ncbi:putative nuclease HARBI1 [Dreissena polymorpha]|uniref:putative nuclease HARBI1 n=1 Tax=Dreissena polymorpha TaxID=45954 RepID=UPI00226521A0|nr:putative nuclease HARBI1 [Dreissena polymorpha]
MIHSIGFQSMYKMCEGWLLPTMRSATSPGSSGRFLNVVSTYPGSTHDAFMFEGCGVKDYLERNDVGYLLGDSGYTLRRYCMTPLANPNSVQQTRFNIAHKRGRVVVERAFGVLKSRFRCLHTAGGCLPFTPSKCAQIVLACMHLHNFCMDRNIMDPTLMPDVDDDDEDDAIVRQTDGVDGTDRRNVIIGRM